MRIIEIVLQTNRLDEMKSFYGELLGFPIEQESSESFTIITGESKIIFQKPVCDLGAYYHFAFTIPSNKLVESKQWLQKKGISCFSNDNQDQFFFPDWNATASYFYDPDGNLLEFIVYHSLHNPSEAPFSQHSILYISEIGLPVPNVAEGSKHIYEICEQEIWRKDEKQFAAIGDVEGLFILIETSRPWFPDARMPGVFPTLVKIQGDLDKQVQLYDLPYQIMCTTKVHM
ncbi:VOC family protein [Brevibacillus laterosporus]|uniref:VOC family protein n=1 Tax=Brevibacillus laterosporus TaxID=1465 RepID=UPI000E6D1787|nr:VOC family protein [Brevibacillus laterosporus]AYB38369.1 glyoxalase [Brevibacillus laterosporus]MBM7110407.1 Glyoxalase-like domain protein [Brevibacillus laterosporus]